MLTRAVNAQFAPVSGSFESMVKKRPMLPSGHSLADAPAVRSVLHCDERCELYSLNSSDTHETVLLLVRHRGDPSTEMDRLRKWWAAQDPQILTLRRSLDAAVCPRNSSGAVLELKGCRLEDQSFANAKEDILKRLFRVILDVVDRGLSVEMCPDFNPGLAWMGADESTMCTLLPLNGNVPSEADQVRHVAMAFHAVVTGIQSEPSVSSLPPLVRWSKFSGDELSRVVDRCVATAAAKSRITTIAGLKNALGCENKRDANSPEGSSASSSTVGVSAAGQGLDKVAGMHALKELLRREVVDPVRNPEPYRRYGLSIPNGILLYGPPGCGKTYIARHLAKELGHYFVEVIPSEIASPYIHQSVIRIRELFDAAAEQAPAVVFIDEFEALVPQRGELGGHQQYKAEEVNEFLAHLNACSERNIFVIAATNQAEKVDSAVRRTGRLDKLIYVGPPDPDARREMLALHLKGRPVSADVSLESLAKVLEGYSASDICFLVDEAAREALRSAEDISNESFRRAMRRIPPSVPPEMEAQYRAFEQRGL
jgi:AAA+ superfamily predicted ATPase